MNYLEITKGNVKSTVEIMVEVAKWCEQTNKNMWNINDLSAESLTGNLSPDNFYIMKINGDHGAAMILQWDDPIFWPDIKTGESGFIHKLCVRRIYSGKGLSHAMIAVAKSECIKRSINYLRLDTGWERHKLRKLYESMGFKNVRKWTIEMKHYALYEMKID